MGSRAVQNMISWVVGNRVFKLESFCSPSVVLSVAKKSRVQALQQHSSAKAAVSAALTFGSAVSKSSVDNEWLAWQPTGLGGNYRDWGDVPGQECGAAPLEDEDAKRVAVCDANLRPAAGVIQVPCLKGIIAQNVHSKVERSHSAEHE